MRYVKVLILALFFFLCLVFLFQNQNVLSQKLTLELNLLAIPKMTSIDGPPAPALGQNAPFRAHPAADLAHQQP